ncbi:MAG TPA: cyclic 2,3-diphosphoglycerate synthase [Polyangia bacterium]|jgi:predicted GTPase
MTRAKVLILGAAGRDFHNFNVFYRTNRDYEVVGFTATQIPGIDTRRYPRELSGDLYPDGLPIYPEVEFERLVRELGVDIVEMAYSDTSHEDVMHLASRALAAGAEFRLLGSRQTMIKSKKPVIAICAVRTGCGKSQTTRYVARMLREHGKKAVAIRHPMPYGDLARQKVERFATYEDLAKYECTIEEREEYEAHVENNTIVYAGVDYEAITRAAEAEADVILWDGGNNDTPFIKPDLWITVADPLRPGHEMKYHPGETNFRAADVIVINKVTDAVAKDVQQVFDNAKKLNPKAQIVMAASELVIEGGEQIKEKRVLLVDDGPTITHGGMPFGAAKVAAERYGAAVTVDPKPYAKGTIKETFQKYTHIGRTLPAMGYSAQQIADLEATINATPCDLVVFATPFDLTRLVKINKPALRVGYELKDLGQPILRDILAKFAK